MRAAALSPLQWGETLSAAPIASGRPIASAPVLVRRWRGVTAQIVQPALDHHYLTLHMGGPKRIRRRGEGGVARGEIAEGAYSMTPAGAAFDWNTEGPVDFAHVYLKPSAIDEVVAAEFDRDPRAVELRDTLGARDPLLEALLAALAASLAEPDRFGRLYWEGLLHTLVCRLLDRHSTLPSIGARAPQALAPYRVRRVSEFVEANLGGDVALADLAGAAGVSPFHFSRVFRRATGSAPYAFLIERRVERAKALLGDTALPLGEVAGACGFGSHSRFSTVFKRATGVSPGRWRARH